jgi:hypothetical protein
MSKMGASKKARIHRMNHMRDGAAGPGVDIANGLKKNFPDASQVARL